MDTFKSLLEGPQGHFSRHFRAHPDFWRHSLGHFGPEDSCRGPACCLAVSELVRVHAHNLSQIRSEMSREANPPNTSTQCTRTKTICPICSSLPLATKVFPKLIQKCPLLQLRASVKLLFSLRACRSSSGNFLFFFAGKICGQFGGNFAGFFRTHQKEAQNFQGKFWSLFRDNVRCSKKNCHAKICSADLPP